MTPITQGRMLLSVAEAAGILGVSRAHVWRCISSGRFGPELIRIGRLVKIRREELVAWIGTGCPGAARWEWEPMKGGCRCAQ